MRRWIVVLLIISMAILGGCQAETDLEAYMTAVEKTEGAVQGKSESRFVIDNQFNAEGLSIEEKRAMAAFERMEFDTYVRYDETRVQSDFYMNFGGVGFDAAYYQTGDLEFLKLPLVGKYMKLNASEMESVWDPQVMAIFDPLGEEWMRMLREDNVFQGKRHVLATEDGDIKVTRFSIELDEQQIQGLVDLVAGILKENEKVLLESGFFGDLSEEEGQRLVQAFADQAAAVRFDEFVFTADIDIDGYLIQDEFHGVISYGDGDRVTSTVDVKTLYWGFHEEPDFSIPTPTEAEWIDETDPDVDPAFLMEFMGGMTE